MKNEKLIEEYVHYFGDEPPFPPKHIMKTLVEMKRDGSFEEKVNKLKPHMDHIRKNIKDVTGEDLSLDHPLFDINMRDDE